MKKLMHSKQGKVFIVFTVIFTIIAILMLWATTQKSQKSLGDFGERQIKIINTINTKDGLNLYIQNAAEIAVKNTLQQNIANTAGRISDPSSTNSKDFSACGTHIYPLLSNKNGTLCNLSGTYEEGYLKEFEKNLRKIQTESYFIRGNLLWKDYDSFITNGILYGVGFQNGGVEIPIVSEVDFKNLLIIPEFIVSNFDISSGGRTYDTINLIKKIESVNLPTQTDDSSSTFIKNLIEIAYQNEANTQQILDKLKLSDLPWIVAAKYFSDSERIVYAGEGLDYSKLISLIDEGKLKEGDFVFTASKNGWCKWSGQNYYDSLDSESKDNRCDMQGELFRVPPDTGFCEKGSINLERENPIYCAFNEDNIKIDKMPIVTHMLCI